MESEKAKGEGNVILKISGSDSNLRPFTAKASLLPERKNTTIHEKKPINSIWF